jgi:hypothetical protein
MFATMRSAYSLYGLIVLLLLVLSGFGASRHTTLLHHTSTPTGYGTPIRTGKVHGMAQVITLHQLPLYVLLVLH